jgi:hypothetical protein
MQLMDRQIALRRAMYDETINVRGGAQAEHETLLGWREVMSQHDMAWPTGARPAHLQQQRQRQSDQLRIGKDHIIGATSGEGDPGERRTRAEEARNQSAPAVTLRILWIKRIRLERAAERTIVTLRLASRRDLLGERVWWLHRHHEQDTRAL